MNTYTGFTEKTSEHLLLDAGAFFKNFDMQTDTFETAVSGGKLIGATRGGGEFSATPTIRKVEIDGVKGRAKGMSRLDEWEAYIKANVLEVTEETIKAALCATNVSETYEKYKTFEGKNDIELDDYIENVTWIGTLSGSGEPVIIQVFNALNTDGLKVATQDKNEGVLTMTFYGHYDDPQKPPFAIHYPKVETTT